MRASSQTQERLSRYRATFGEPSVFLNLRQGAPFHLGALPAMAAHRRLAECFGGELPREVLSAKDQASEYLMMCLRLAEGLDMARYAMLAGRPLPEAAVAGLEDIGMVHRTGSRLTATRDGRAVLNAVIRELMP